MKKTKAGTVIAVAVVLIFAVTGCLVLGVYNGFLKPDDFSDYIICSSGDNTGYYRHCYEELNESEKRIYNIILPKLYETQEKIEIPAMQEGDDLNKIFIALSHDNPDLINLGLNCKVYKSGYKTYFEAEYTKDNATYQKQLKEAKAVAQVIIDGAAEFTSEYEKEKFVHDYIINHSTYVDPTEGSNANNIYGCLVEGKAGCEGYSRTFQYIMSNLNIDNRIISGKGKTVDKGVIPHMWNLVNINDKNYFVDVTWDDPVGDGNIVKHTYFNLTTADILLNHSDIEQNIPFITDNEYNYFIYENCYSNTGSGTAFETVFSNAVFNSVYNNRKNVEIRFPNGAVLEQAKNSLFTDGVVYSVFKDAGIIPADSSEPAKVFYSQETDLNSICVYF